MKIRVIKHEVVPDCGSYEVHFPDGVFGQDGALPGEVKQLGLGVSGVAIS
jgi:hypothetical protein